MVTATQITREAPFLEDFRRRFLQAGFDLTKASTGPTTTPREIAGFRCFTKRSNGTNMLDL